MRFDNKNKCSSDNATMAPRYGGAQKQFIKDNRTEVDLKQHKHFQVKDWRNVTPLGGKYVGLLSTKKINTDSFYVKPLAVWVPHLLLPDYVPSCPNCKCNKHVEVASARWVSYPKILFGISCQKYLDTKFYPCRKCNKEFTGYNKTTLSLDATAIIGYFNFYLASKYAVEEALYSFIVNSPDTSSARIARHIHRMTVDNYHQDYQLFLHAVRANRIQCGPGKKVSNLDRSQPIITAALEEQIEKSGPVNRLLNGLKRDIRILQSQIDSVTAVLDLSVPRNKLCFYRLLDKKKSRNARNLPLPSLGTAKLQQLIDLGVDNAVDLLGFEDVNGVFYSTRTRNVKLNKWKAEASHYFEEKRKRLRDLKKRLKAKEAELAEVDTWRDIENAVAPDNNNNLLEPEATPNEALPRPSLFTSMEDPTGYNARYLSAGQVNAIQETEFRHRKPMQDAKMMGLSAEICKIDWSYKVAGKTYVYTGPGKCFKPYTSMFNMQNEDGLTVFWKVVEGGESLVPLKPDLIRFKNRNQRLGKSTAVVYIDVCCKFRNSLKAIFGPHLLVKLDCFHWHRRWDPALANPKSEKGAMFRSSMSQALFEVTSEEFARSRRRLIEKHRNKHPTDLQWVPTVKAIRKEANKIIPQPEVLLERVMALIRYIKFCDAETDMQIATRNPTTSTDPVPLRFFKNHKDTDILIQQQLEHVVNGCLSDPPTISMHHANPSTKAFFCRRGTSSIESDHRGLDLLTGTHIGVGLCDRKTSTYFEMLNERKRVNRLGGTDYGTHRTETLALMNSLASSAGYTDTELPFAQLAVPALPPLNDQEYFGFHKVPHLTQQAFWHRYKSSNPGLSDTQLAAEMDGFATDLDEIIDPNEGVDPDVLAQDDADAEGSDLEIDEDDPVIEAAVERIVPLIRPKETTAQAYERLTNQQPWYPFHSGDTAPSEIDIEEFATFDTMRYEFKRHVSPRAKDGYQAFAAKWNREVARRYQQLLDGEIGMVLIRRKSASQLQDHFDSCEKKERMAQQADCPNDVRRREELRDTIRQTRRLVTMPDIPEAVVLQYSTTGTVPFGMPNPLNPGILHGAMATQTLRGMQQNADIGRPWMIQQFATSTNVLSGYLKKAWCISCGYRKGHHLKEERFGHRCLREYCPKCGWRQEHHLNSGGRMGPYCMNPATYDSPHRHWYANDDTRQTGVI